MSKMPRYRIIFALLIGLVSLFAQDIDEAIRLFNASQFEQARTMFQQVVQDKNEPRIAEAYYYLGRLSIAPDSAVFYYNKVTNDYPQSRYGDIAYLEIAKIHIAREKYSNAIISLNELMRKFPDTEYQDEIMFWLGYSYINSGKKQEGEAILEELKKKFPKSLWSERAAVILPTKDTPPVSEEYYTVQVGSYRNKNNADNYAGEMRAKGYEVDVVEALVKGNTYFRVWVGKFPSLQEAKTFSQELVSQGIKGNVVKAY
jgi:tetratricopeptide (TPR) repeat protein